MASAAAFPEGRRSNSIGSAPPARRDEKCFAYLIHEDRSVLELTDATTLLNEKLPTITGLTNLSITT